jgi:hypothetical protein
MFPSSGAPPPRACAGTHMPLSLIDLVLPRVVRGMAFSAIPCSHNRRANSRRHSRSIRKPMLRQWWKAFARHFRTQATDQGTTIESLPLIDACDCSRNVASLGKCQLL